MGLLDFSYLQVYNFMSEDMYFTEQLNKHATECRLCGFSFYLYDKTQAFYFAAVLDASGHNVDSGGVDTAVTQDICKFGNIFLDAIEGSGKQFPQVVGKHLGFLHSRSFAELFHLAPDTAAVKRLTTLANKDRPSRNTFLLSIIQ